MKHNNIIQEISSSQNSINLSKKRTRTQFREGLLQNLRSQTTQTQSQSIKSPLKTTNQYSKRTQSTARKQNKTRQKSKKTEQRQSEIIEYFRIKKCKKIGCSDIEKNEDLILCETCTDAYHWFCIDKKHKTTKPEDDNERFECSKCQEGFRVYKKLKLDQSMSKKKKEEKCHLCDKKLNPDLDYIKSCQKCQQAYHEKCFEKQNDHMFCNHCYKEFVDKVDSLFPKPTMSKNRPLTTCREDEKLFKTPSIKNYFQNQKHQYDFDVLSYQLIPEGEQQAFSTQQLSKINKPKSRKRKAVSVTTKKKRTFKLPKLIDDPILDIQVTESFQRAFFAKNMHYTTELVYDDPETSESMNKTEFEPRNIQTLNKSNAEALQQLKQRELQGVLPPLLITYDIKSGFGVEAAINLPDLCLLCEYVGEVRKDRQTLFQKDNDSLMKLLVTGDSDTSLVIAPEKYANIGRFFNGINNSKKDTKTQRVQNLRSMRCQIDGRVAILIYTRRAIKKGEALLYDYNEAGNDYDTENFV